MTASDNKNLDLLGGGGAQGGVASWKPRMCMKLLHFTTADGQLVNPKWQLY